MRAGWVRVNVQRPGRADRGCGPRGRRARGEPSRLDEPLDAVCELVTQTPREHRRAGEGDERSRSDARRAEGQRLDPLVRE